MRDAVAAETVFLARAAETDFAALIPIHINEAIRSYESQRFWFNEQRFELETEAGRGIYALPLQYVRMLSLLIVEPRRLLDGVSIEEIEENEPRSGVPERYAIFDNQYFFDPVPDGVYTLRLYGVRRFDPLVADGDSSPWTNAAYDLISEAAKERIFRKVLHQEQDAALSAQAAAAAFQVLRNTTDKRISNTTTRGWI